MFCYQRKYYSEVEVIDSIEAFEKVLHDKETSATLLKCREALHAKKDAKTYADSKRELPLFIFQASKFDWTRKREKDGSDGPVGYWRVQEAAHLNGLCVLDIDHIEDPVQVYTSQIEPWVKRQQDDASLKWRIKMVYITPSEQGLKVVFTADPAVGNLADNQAAFSEALGVMNDESIKDASRGSFAVTENYVLYLEKDIVDYINEDFEKAFGEDYRKNNSRPKKRQAKQGKSNRSGDAAGDSRSDSDNAAGGGSDAGLNIDDLKYGNIPVQSICERYVAKYGSPVTGDRHRSLIKLAGHLRYVVDNDPKKLKVALRAVSWVSAWESEEKNTREIDDVADDICQLRMWRELPKAISAIVSRDSRDSVEGSYEVANDAASVTVKGDQREIWDRLRPLLEDDPLYADCTSHLRDGNKIAGIFAAGGMFCTLATRLHYLHFDGRQHRMNPQVTIIGMPASGKSFADEMDAAIMAPMRAADEPGRRAEAEYKKEQKKRRTSNKAAKGEQQMKEPEECIRYIPSRTSNAIFYRRQQNAKEVVDGEVMPLHLYTFDSELDSSVQAQSGGSWISKHDLELKAFHNEKSGVDYANADSVNEVITVYWNQVITGTDVSLAKKINMRNINDGLCSRIAICRIADDEFAMIGRGKAAEIDKNFKKMEEWGYFFDSLRGELVIPKLVEHVYKLCEKAAKVAKEKNDLVLNYFRKRAVFYAEWFTIPRILARMKMQKDAGIDVNILKPQILQSDLDFAELMFDTVIYYQDVFFGKMLEETWANGQNAFKIRNLTRTSRNEQMFETLPMEFSMNDVINMLAISKKAARLQIKRWHDRNLITNISKELWKKTV